MRNQHVPSDDADEAVVGSALASKLGVHAGDTITLAGASGTKDLAVTGVYAPATTTTRPSTRPWPTCRTSPVTPGRSSASRSRP